MKVTFNFYYSGVYSVTVEGEDVDEMENAAEQVFRANVSDYSDIDEITKDFDTEDEPLFTVD